MSKMIKLPSPEEMIRAGVHMGHRSAKWHPKMAPYISGVRQSIHIIDLDQTAAKLTVAIEFIKKLIAEKKLILLVATKLPHENLIREIAERLDMPFVVGRWLGGTLTNFKTIAKRLEYFQGLETKRAAGELEKYTKRERHQIDKELDKLQKKFAGLKKLNRLPDALLAVDCKEDILSIKEARRLNIPVVAICDTNADPSLINYPIPANDDAISAVRLILEAIIDNIEP